jgi:hypothetical protein
MTEFNKICMIMGCLIAWFPSLHAIFFNVDLRKYRRWHWTVYVLAVAACLIGTWW